jgi:hypothetical protein
MGDGTIWTWVDVKENAWMGEDDVGVAGEHGNIGGCVFEE